MRINLHQQTPEWTQWRRTHVCASELAAIIGENPWMDANTLWKRKLGMIPEQEDNENMRRGRELEETARQLYCQKAVLCFEPEVHIHPVETWAGASLDGINLEGDEILEIKCPKEQWDKIPDYYLPQIHWQLFCSGAKICHFVSYVDGNIKVWLIERADAYIEKLVEAGREFYRRLMEFDPPPSKEDETVLVEDDYTVRLAQEYFNLRERIKQLESQQESVKEALVRHMPAKKCYCAGLTIQQVETPGRVDYSAIPQLKEVDLNLYRKPPTKTWRVT